MFRNQPTNSGGTDIFVAPNESPATAAEYDAWAHANNRPLSATPAGAAALQQVQQIVTTNRLPSGALPANFFTVPLPEGFALKDANAFDITTVDGYKLYRPTQSYLNFGGLYALPNARYVHFGLKLYS